MFVVVRDAAGLFEQVVEGDLGGDVFQAQADFPVAEFVLRITDHEVRAVGRFWVSFFGLLGDHEVERFEPFGKGHAIDVDAWKFDRGELVAAAFGNQFFPVLSESAELIAGVGVIGFEAQGFGEGGAGTGDVALGHGVHAQLVGVIGITSEGWQGEDGEGDKDGGVFHEDWVLSLCADEIASEKMGRCPNIALYLEFLNLGVEHPALKGHSVGGE